MEAFYWFGLLLVALPALFLVARAAGKRGARRRTPDALAAERRHFRLHGAHG